MGKKDKDIVEDLSNNSTDLADFEPTPHMKVWLDKALEIGIHNITKVARECGVDRSSWYHWIKDPAFRAWFKKQWDDHLAIRGPELDSIGLIRARADHKYWEDMQKRCGNLKDEPKGIGLQVEGSEMKVEFIEYD